MRGKKLLLETEEITAVSPERSTSPFGSSREEETGQVSKQIQRERILSPCQSLSSHLPAMNRCAYEAREKTERH